MNFGFGQLNSHPPPCYRDSIKQVVLFGLGYQSGSYTAMERHITKRGNKYLRKVIFEVCLSYIQHKPKGDPVYQFIEKKRSEGKCGKEALVAGMNKFLRIYYGKVTELYRDLEL